VKVIGLTGNIGCGKSTVAAMLREHRVATLDADEVARQVRETDDEARDAITRRFGTLDAAGLGAIVFAEPGALADLEAIVHPRVRDRVRDWLAGRAAEGATVAAIEAIKLLESPLRERCDQVWVVVCRPEEALQRLTRRGLSEGEVAARRANQMPQADMVLAADVAIDGSAEPGETRRQVDAALATLTAGRG
jgi:dephospho-CoA kinase